MRNALLPALAVAVFGSTMALAPVGVSDAETEFADFFAAHDELHHLVVEERPTQDVIVRSVVWNDADRTIYVDAETTLGKGSLVVVEGMPVSDWVTAFKIAKSKNVSFQLPIPDNELIPCRIIVRSAHAYRITRVIDAPPTCVADAEAENTLLASL